MNGIVLDAMGVIFHAADDVAELLVPFIAEQGGERRQEIIEAAYLEASLGAISADAFWSNVQVSSEQEDRYLALHSLTPGVNELLFTANRKGIPVWCLSNDVGRWSQKLRERFNIEARLTGSVISGDVGVRKPDRGIYDILLKRCGYPAEELLFIDDREKNIAAARALGIESMQFDSVTGFRPIMRRIDHA